MITPNDCILHKIRENLTSFAPKNEGKESQISFNLRRVFVLICFNLPISIPVCGRCLLPLEVVHLDRSVEARGGHHAPGRRIERAE